MESTTAGANAKAGAGKKRKKEAFASESGDNDATPALNPKKEKKSEEDSLFKEGEMLKLREDFWEAELLWGEKLVPGALDRWLEEKKITQVPAEVGKKKRVVRVIFPDTHIDFIKKNPNMMRELSDEEMAKCPERFRQIYDISKVINAKKRAYLQAIIDQYQAFGFAYDEKEVTDDEEEEPEAVVKN